MFHGLILESDAAVQFRATDLIGAHFAIHLFHMLIETRVTNRTSSVSTSRARRWFEIFCGLVIVADMALLCCDSRINSSRLDVCLRPLTSSVWEFEHFCCCHQRTIDSWQSIADRGDCFLFRPSSPIGSRCDIYRNAF